MRLPVPFEMLGPLPFSTGPGESKSKAREPLPGIMPGAFNTFSSPEYEFCVRDCDMARSCDLSILSSHSCAEAEVADPSDVAALGSSKV